MKKFKKGDKLVVIGCKSGHGILNGTKLTFKDSCGGNGIMVEEDSSWFDSTDVKLFIQTIEQLNDEMAEVKEKIAEHELELTTIQSKIDYLTETGGKIFDENEYRAYTTLKALEDGNLSTIERARKIASIFNN